jgi:hypothetical protein
VQLPASIPASIPTPRATSEGDALAVQGDGEKYGLPESTPQPGPYENMGVQVGG